MGDLHARLLAEIERREGRLVDSGVRFGFRELSHIAKDRAYLGALRGVVELHRYVRVGDKWVCERCDDANRVAPGETCAEIAIVATALDVTP